MIIYQKLTVLIFSDSTTVIRGVNLKFHHNTILHCIEFLENNMIFADITKSAKISIRFTGACDQYEMTSYGHLTQSVIFISTQKKQQI